MLASMACSDDFGRQMHRESKRRRFFEAKSKVFLGDGLPWNWTIWKRHFSDFVPVLDVIHPLSYLHKAAKAVHESEPDVWSQYVVWMTGCWRGEVDQALAELQAWQAKLGDPDEDCDETDPRSVISTTPGYLTNNASRMNYRSSVSSCRRTRRPNRICRQSATTTHKPSSSSVSIEGLFSDASRMRFV